MSADEELRALERAFAKDGDLSTFARIASLRERLGQNPPRVLLLDQQTIAANTRTQVLWSGWPSWYPPHEGDWYFHVVGQLHIVAPEPRGGDPLDILLDLVDGDTLLDLVESPTSVELELETRSAILKLGHYALPRAAGGVWTIDGRVATHVRPEPDAVKLWITATHESAVLLQPFAMTVEEAAQPAKVSSSLRRT